MPSTLLKLSSFDPSPFGFPRPKVPLLPKRTVNSGDNTPPMKNSFRTAKYGFRSFARGRYALGAAYRLCGIGPKTSLMVPAYHCLSMLDPAIALGADMLLYPLHPDLSPDIDRLDALFSSAAHPVTALLAAHYFGLVQNFAPLRDWCATRDITLIEDCSHVLFTETVQAPRTGICGKYITASPYKFFTCEDGGLLCTSDPHLLDAISTRSTAWIDEVRGIKRLLEEQRRPSLANTGSPSVSDRLPLETRLAESVYRQPSRYFIPKQAYQAALRSSRWLIHHASIDNIAAARHKNYMRWLNTVTALPNCQPLYPDWPTDDVPYMFPLLIDHPDPHFFQMKQAGVPIWRWDEIAISDTLPHCAIARRYQLQLLHLPCHQGLDEAQMDWMVDVVKSTLLKSVEGGEQ
jgi:dTDP-4-amino-4,6-dideoxygalactose transaminase